MTVLYKNLSVGNQNVFCNSTVLVKFKDAQKVLPTLLLRGSFVV